MVTLVNEPQYKRLCATIEREDLANDPRFADFARRADAADALISQMREVFLSQSTETWLSRLHAADIIAERILNPGEWLRNVHVEATRARGLPGHAGGRPRLRPAHAGHREFVRRQSAAGAGHRTGQPGDPDGSRFWIAAPSTI